MKNVAPHWVIPALVTPALVTWVALGAVEVGAQPAGDPRPLVDVRVVVAEPDVRADFDHDLPELAARVADGLVEFLNREIRFLRFVTESTADPQVVLDLTLGDADAPPFLHPLELFAQLSGPALVAESRPLVIVVRDAVAAMSPRGTVASFTEEIVEAAAGIGHQTWVAELFDLVVLGGEAHAFQDPSGWYWALPFRLEEVGAETSTEFLVDSELTVFGNPQQLLTRAAARGHVGTDHPSVPELFWTKALARVTNDEDADLMGQATQCRSRRILVSKYVRDFGQILNASTGSDLDLSVAGDGGAP